MDTFQRKISKKDSELAIKEIDKKDSDQASTGNKKRAKSSMISNGQLSDLFRRLDK